MNLRRIRWTLTAWYVAVLLIIVLITSGLAYFRLASLLRSQVDQSLRSSASALAGQVTEELVEHRQTPESTSSEAASTDLSYLTGASGDAFVAILTPQGEAIENPLRVPLAEFADNKTLQAAGETALLRTQRLDSNDYRLLYLPVKQSDQTIAIVVVGRSLEEQSRELRRLLLVLAASSGGGLTLALVGGLYMAGKALAPTRIAFDRERRFIADASHELRTPLTLIRASAEALQRQNDGASKTEDAAPLADILSESDRMSNLIRDLLDLARLDDGGEARELVDLADTLDEAERWARAAVGNRQIDVALVSPRAGLLVEANAEQILRVVRALLDNAIRHTPDGGHIQLSGANEGDTVRVMVIDSGPGLAQEELAAIFGRFYRVDQARSTAGSTGLGLAIAKSIIEAHGGTIWAESRPGQGATFSFRLPAAK